MLALGSCAKLTHTAAPDLTAAPQTSFCRVAKPLTYDRLHDTDQTIREVKAHNDVYDGLCGAAPNKE